MINETANLIVYGKVTVIDIATFLVTVAVAILIATFVRIRLRLYLGDRLPKDVLDLLLKIIYYSIILIAVLSVLPRIGISLSGLFVAGGIAGLVIGFASQSVVSNLVSGLFIMFERPVKIGDQVEVDGVSGFVEDIHVMSTVIRTYDGIFVRIPNDKVFTSKIVNYVANPVRRFEYTVGISYADDAEKAIRIIKDVIDREPFALKYPEPQVFVKELGDSSVNITVRVWAPVQVWYDVRMKLLWQIKVELEKAGIEIPFPQRVIWFGEKDKGNETDNRESGDDELKSLDKN